MKRSEDLKTDAMVEYDHQTTERTTVGPDGSVSHEVEMHRRGRVSVHVVVTAAILAIIVSATIGG